MARLETALAAGETAAAKLADLRARHATLETEARAAVDTLDRLIAEDLPNG